jgi:hypothetical protein
VGGGEGEGDVGEKVFVRRCGCRALRMFAAGAAARSSQKKLFARRDTPGRAPFSVLV